MKYSSLFKRVWDTLDNYDGLDDLNIEAFHANSKNLSYMNADRPYVT